MPRLIESRDQIPNEQYRDLLKQLLESQAYRELMAANVFGAAIRHVPDLGHKLTIANHIKEELEHFERVHRLYRDLTGGAEVEEAVRERLARVPYAESWLELAVVQFLYDRAGEFHLMEYRTSSYAPYRQIINKILEEEEGHEGFGETVLKQATRDPAKRAEAQRYFEKWLPIAMLSFGRPRTAGNRYAVSVGLKSRDSGEVMQDYLNDIKPVMVACGLTFPPRDQLGIDLPADIDLTLPSKV